MYLVWAIDECDMGLFDDESGASFAIAMTIEVLGITATSFHNLMDIFKVHRQRFFESRIYFRQTNSVIYCETGILILP